jgi:hypothetical protein
LAPQGGLEPPYGAQAEYNALTVRPLTIRVPGNCSWCSPTESNRVLRLFKPTYAPAIPELHEISWRGRRDSNPRWSPRQGGALAAMLLPHEFGIAYGNRTRLFGLKDRGSHQKSNAILFGNGCGTRTHVLLAQNQAALPVKLPRISILVPAEGIEPSTYALSRRCSTTELSRHEFVWYPVMESNHRSRLIKTAFYH